MRRTTVVLLAVALVMVASASGARADTMVTFDIPCTTPTLNQAKGTNVLRVLCSPDPSTSTPILNISDCPVAAAMRSKEPVTVTHRGKTETTWPIIISCANRPTAGLR